jgi:hypothetical protein
LMMHFIILIPSIPTSSKWSLSFRSPHRYPLCTSPVPHKCHISRPSHFSLFSHPKK